MTTALFNTCKDFLSSFMGTSSSPNMNGDEPLRQGRFANCRFAIIRSAGLTDKNAGSLSSELELHGGEVVIDNYPEGSLDLRGITHVISTTYDFPDYHACCDALIPVVKPMWVTHSLAKDKLQNPRQYNPDPRFFMSDVVACVADLPQGDSDAIAGGIIAMGGLFATKLTSQVTHIITLSIDSDTCVYALKKRLNVKIVLPHWVDDCLKLGRKIDEQPYKLPDPEILLPRSEKAPAGKRKTPVEGASDPDPSQQQPGAGAPRKLRKVFKKKTVFLSRDLGISEYLRGILDGIITVSGGKLTDSVEEADMYIGKYREGKEYKIASRAGKDVGNLAWLYFLIQTDEWTSPLRRLLHYPVTREGIPGFSSLKISVSNYSGEARTYLENLINATGAEATKTLKQDNTHLITAHVISEKCAAAKEWGIHIVNHLWLEESYARWKMQSITDGRYTHFPHRTNLGDVVGHTQLDRRVLEQFFLPNDETDTKDAQKTAPMRQVHENTVPAAEDKPAKKSSRKQASKDASAAQVQTPAPSRFVPTGKENMTPSTTNSRKSKEVASARLHELTPDILLYEKEKKRVGGVVYGGRRKADDDRVLVVARKRSVEQVQDKDVDSEPESKKVKRGTPTPLMHLVISGYTKWVGHPRIEDNDKKQLRGLGIICTLDPARATHLAAPRIVRTQKFVTALAYAPMVITTDFVEACLKENKLLNPEDFLLQDKDTEKRLGISLKSTRERARQNQNRLLHGRIIYCMENIGGGFETFKTIVEANGGRCLLWRNRKGQTVPSGRADSDASTDIDVSHEVYLLTDEKKENKPMWNRFREMAEGSRKVPRIVLTDWLLESAMSQQILPTDRYEV
ncbi:BRCT-containing protein 1 [Exophiala dermatitidis]